LAQAPPTYLVDYFSNNAGPVPGAPDQLIRLVNVGLGGTPLTSPQGDICADIYVFDNNQEMISCCSCRLTPNELGTASIGTQLTNNPVTSVVPPAGVIKIVASSTPKSGCDPTLGAFDDATIAAPSGGPPEFVAGFATHLQVTGGATSVTETNIPVAALSSAERQFLPLSCAFAQYLGSGKGTCKCSVPGQ
jgi:hypothetical protein